MFHTDDKEINQSVNQNTFHRQTAQSLARGLDLCGLARWCALDKRKRCWTVPTQDGEKTAVITVETLVSAAYNKVCLKSLKLAATKINLMIEPWKSFTPTSDHKSIGGTGDRWSLSVQSVLSCEVTNILEYSFTGSAGVMTDSDRAMINMALERDVQTVS